MRTLALALLAFFPASAFASGSWVSSGGELFQLAKNPWFVKGAKGGTSEVRYCIQVDRSSFSADESTVRAAVQAAIDYWRGELDTGPGPQQGFARLADQKFTLQAACDAQSDIRFLMGYGTLSAQEVEFLTDPSKYVGVTVRTDYDQVSLKGRGFVYISSDRGEHAYHNPGDLVSNAWESQKLLQYVLIHEMGHVMGIPHTGVGLMSEVFPEQVVNKRFSEYYKARSIPSFLNPPLVFDVCQMNGSFNAAFFKVPAGTQCLSVTGLKDPGGDLQWNIAIKDKPQSDPKPWGAIRAQLSGTSIAGAHPAVVIHLPQEQAVYSFQERLMNGFMLGAVYQEGSAKGAFRLQGSLEPMELQIELHPDSITMTGTVDGKPTPVLIFSPPSLLNLLMPVSGLGP